MSATALSLKAEGNAHLAKQEWEKAIESYTQALEVATDAETKAHLYSNRAAARIQFDKLAEGTLYVYLNFQERY